MNLWKSKRGIADMMVLSISWIIMTTVVIFTVVFLLQAYVRDSIDVFETESSLFSNRIFFLKSLNYLDSQGRLHPGVIDLAKYNSDKISDAMGREIHYGENNVFISARLYLRNLDDSGGEYKGIYYNPVLFERTSPLYHAGLTRGSGGVRSKTKSFYVLIKEGEKTSNGVLKVEVMFQNT